MPLTKVSFSMIDGASANVVDYGADPTGANDSSSAFTNALGEGVGLTIPYGTYKLNSVVTVTEPPIIYGNSLTSTLSNGLYINCVGGYRGNVQNVRFVSNTGTGIALRTNDTHLTKFDSVSATGFQNGAEFNYSWSNTLVNCEFHANDTGAVFIDNANAFGVYSCHFTNNTNNGASVSSSQKITFTGCDFSNNTNYGLVIDSDDNDTLQCLSVKVDSAYSEGNDIDYYIGFGTNAIKVEGCVFTDNAHFGTKSYAYFVDNALSTKIINPDFTGAVFTSFAIYLGSASQNTTIIPFIPAQVGYDAGATVSMQTIQTGTLDVTLDGGGYGEGTVTFPIPYHVAPNISVQLYDTDTSPSGSIGSIFIKNGFGSAGFYFQIWGGPASQTVKVKWKAGG